MSGIIGTQIVQAGNTTLNIGGHHGSWNSAVAVRRSNSNHHSSRYLLSLDSRKNKFALNVPRPSRLIQDRRFQNVTWTRSSLTRDKNFNGSRPLGLSVGCL